MLAPGSTCLPMLCCVPSTEILTRHLPSRLSLQRARKGRHEREAAGTAWGRARSYGRQQQGVPLHRAWRYYAWLLHLHTLVTRAMGGSSQPIAVCNPPCDATVAGVVGLQLLLRCGRLKFGRHQAHAAPSGVSVAWRGQLHVGGNACQPPSAARFVGPGSWHPDLQHAEQVVGTGGGLLQDTEGPAAGLAAGRQAAGFAAVCSPVLCTAA